MEKMMCRICPNISLKLFRLLLFIMAAMLVVPAFAQKAKPDKLYENKQYHAAALAYENELSKGKAGNRTEVWMKIGLCYLNINQPLKALPWLQQVIDEGTGNGNSWYQYGLALQQTGKYFEAMNAFEQCLKLQVGHPLAANKIVSCQYALKNNPINPYTNFRLAKEVNTDGGEFGVSLFAKDIIYYSEASVPTEGSKIDQRTGLQYTESYMARLRNKRIINPQITDNSLPQYITAGLFAYDSLKQCTYFAYCDLDNNRCGIYSSQLNSGKWSAPELVLQSKKDQAVGHPALANGGNRLFFTSNASEGVGQTDIWFIDRSADGHWGQPVNAGNVINTFGREEFPFVYADSLLFFASDGHVGYGGLDIFCSVIKGNSFSPPINLRRPFNSPGDDFNLIIKGNTGLISSSRNESVSDDIYMFEGLPSLQYLSGNVFDATTGDIIKGARLTLSIDGKASQQTVSDSTGYYGFFLKGEELPMMYVRAIGYKPSLTEVKPFEMEQFVDMEDNIGLQPSTVQPIIVNLYNKITGNPIAERGIICFNNDGETQIMRTDASGSFKLIIQEDQREYWIKFPDGYYLTESIILNEEQKTYSLNVQPFNDELFPGWLHFKKGSIELTEMSQALFPRIVSVLKANPGMTFQIVGYGDMTSEINQSNLPGQRAEFVVRRMVEDGVDKRQLVAVAGKGQESNESATEEENASQRKIEIKVKK